MIKAMKIDGQVMMSQEDYAILLASDITPMTEYQVEEAARIWAKACGYNYTACGDEVKREMIGKAKTMLYAIAQARVKKPSLRSLVSEEAVQLMAKKLMLLNDVDWDKLKAHEKQDTYIKVRQAVMFASDTLEQRQGDD